MESPKEIQSYKFLEKLGESIQAEVFKVHLLGAPGRPFVLKKIKQGVYHDPTSHLSRQIDYLTHLHIPGMIFPTLHMEEGAPPFLLQEYFQGMTLGEWMKSVSEVPLKDFFQISCSLASTLDRLHSAGHFHGGIKPNNILVAQDKMEIKLIDPVRVMNINEMSHYIYDEGFRMDTLPYISPEQTGRIKYEVGYATDLYSLGVVMYELLWEKPPFTNVYPLDIIHSHLAQKPNFPKTKRDIPEVLGEIVARLLAKEPERRYRTGRGLLYDLERCQKEYGAKGKIYKFVPGLRDYSNRINTPSIMVGRDKEKRLLLEEHAISCRGSFRSAMISGLPGIGKTRLIQELQRPIIVARGYFTSGKFDQYQKNVPYSTLIQTYRNLLNTFLTEESDRLEYWRETIDSAIGVNARLITDLIPDLGLIIGEQPHIPSMPPIEARNRFNDTLERFLSCLASRDHPLTLFVDDLQWCDTATFEIIENIFLNADDHPFLFFLGAYRHNELDEGHPLRHLLERIRAMKTPMLELRIDKLNESHCNEMVAYILNSSPSKTEDLSGIIMTTAGGNPLYINESISWLHNNDLIDLDDKGRWHWDDERIRVSRIPETTATLFKNKVNGVSPETLKILRIAACLGVRFKAEDLNLVTGIEMASLYGELAPAFSRRILVKGRGHVSFFHDRVQEAVLSTITDREGQRIHNQIAESLVKAIPKGVDLETLDNLFAIVEHLNKGRSVDADEDTLLRDARFNYYAGSKAMDSLALEAANRYFRNSGQLLPASAWDRDYELTFALFKDSAKSELTQGNQRKSEIMLKTLLERSRTDLDKAECLAEQAENLSSLGEFQKSIDLSIQGLAYLDKSIPIEEEDVRKRIDELDRLIKDANVSIVDILNKEPLSNSRDLIELTIYSQLIPNYYLLGKADSFFLVGLEGVFLCLSAGLHSQSIYPFGVYMPYLLEKGDFEDAFTYEDLILQLCNRFPNTVGELRGMLCIAWLSYHLRKNPSEVFDFSLKTIERGKRSGDTYHTGLAYCAAFWSAMLQGNDMDIIEHSVSECERYTRKYNLPFFSEGMAKGMRAAWIEPMKSSGASMDMDKDIDGWRQSQDITLLGNYHIHAGMAEYYLGNFQIAYEHTMYGEGCLTGLTNNIPYRQWHIFFVLNTLRLLGSDPFEDDIHDTMSKIQPIIENIELWAGFGPTLRPYLAFIYAEKERLIDDFRETRMLYLDAIDSAHEQGYTLLEGHIHEYLGEFLSRHGNRQAYYHIGEAEGLYKRCHAKAKLKLIRERYPEYLPAPQEEKHEEEPLSQKLDTAYLMKATMAISQELDLEELLKTIMRAVMESLGAQSGYILTEDRQTLVISAYGVKDRTLNVSLREEALSDAVNISQAIIRYVHRTRKTVVLGNAMEEGRFAHDKEVRALRLRSVLCCPILKQQALVGIIYLQNSLMKTIFQEEDLELVRLLAAQAAISLENARLIKDVRKLNDELEQRVIERTAQLEATNKELETFAYSVSHDLRAPLRGIDGFCHALLEDHEEKLDEEGKGYLNRIRTASQRMAQLIDDLLRLSRLTRVDMHYKVIDLSRLAVEIADELQEGDPERCVDFKIEENLTTRGDEHLLRLALKNLMDNAWKFTSSHERAKIEFGVEEADNEPAYFVRDDGVGFDMTYANKLFCAFQRLHGAMEFPGTGIGLATVQRIIHRHGGRVWAKSVVEEGAAFYFTL